jgi:uncharacterized membrane protein
MMQEMSKEILSLAVSGLRLGLEIVGAAWITIGAFYALRELVVAHVSCRTTSFTSIRLEFSRYLSLALEFQLASDILSTAIAPTWDEIGKLAATATITALNYFLSREMWDYSDKQLP